MVLVTHLWRRPRKGVSGMGRKPPRIVWPYFNPSFQIVTKDQMDEFCDSEKLLRGSDCRNTLLVGEERSIPPQD